MRRKQKIFRGHDPTPSHGAGGRRERSECRLSTLPTLQEKTIIPKKILGGKIVLERLKRKKRDAELRQ